MKPLGGAEVARAVTLACLIEAGVAKPGNVSPASGFADTTHEDFVASAHAIGPAFAGAGEACVGETVLRAVRDTRRAVATNTNLGIVLLLAPLAKAAAGDGAAQGLRRAVARVLLELTVEDARLAYEAIRLATPGAMGRVGEADVADGPPTVTLREAMALAADRDAVAREYASDFALTFDLGVPALARAWREAEGGGARAVDAPSGAALGAVLETAVLTCFLAILAEVPDTLIARKRGLETAREVSARAARVLAAMRTGARAAAGEVAAFDAALRDPGHTLNPGTTADLVVAALFVFLTEGGMVAAVAEEAAALPALGTADPQRRR